MDLQAADSRMVLSHCLCVCRDFRMEPLPLIVHALRLAYPNHDFEDSSTHRGGAPACKYKCRYEEIGSDYWVGGPLETKIKSSLLDCGSFNAFALSGIILPHLQSSHSYLSPHNTLSCALCSSDPSSPSLAFPPLPQWLSPVTGQQMA